MTKRGDNKQDTLTAGDQPMSPLYLAENIELDALREVYGGRRRRAYSELLRTAHYLLESALATDGAESDDYFEAARGNLATMIGGDFSLDDRSVVSLRPEAAIFSAQLPVFNERRDPLCDTVSCDAMGDAHVAMVRLLAGGFSRRAAPEVALPDSRRNELELAGLLSRLGEVALFPYFATEREERSSQWPTMNHDFYAIDPLGRKIPIQAKIRPPRDGRKYDPAVLVLTRKELMQVARKVDIQHGGVSQLLVKEEYGGLNYCERRRLKSLSSYVVDMVQRHAETMPQ